MMVKRKPGYFLHLCAIMSISGLMSLSLYTDNIEEFFLPTAALLAIMYFTYYMKVRITKEFELLYLITACMITIGWLILLRIQPEFAFRQLKWIALGCAAFLVLLRFLDLFSSDFILKHRIYWLLLTVLLLISPLLFGIEAGGAKSWLQVNEMRFQPSEAAKVTFLVFLCAWFKEHGSLRGTWFAWLGTFTTVGILVLQRDLGTALIFYLTFLCILYLVTGKMKGPLMGLIFLVIGSVAAYFYFPHVRVRAMGWLNPWLEPDRGGYQIIQSLFALANGGIWGMGFGGGMPGAIPEAHTDFVFAVIGEQFGLFGTIGVVILYLFFSFFSLKRAQLIPTLGSRLLAAGLSIIILLQAFIIMGGVTKLIPLTGLPLPFMSYGGSSTLSSFTMLGIIIWLNREKGFVPAVTRRRLININRLVWILMFCLIVNISYWQVLKAETLIDNPLNPRWRLIEKATQRGAIYAFDGSPLAFNSSDPLGRSYPLKEAGAHLVGYNSLKYGKAGLESFTNGDLLAIPSHNPGPLPQSRLGWDVYTTINPHLQSLAWQLMKDKVGAVVVMEVKTGNVLALVSSPSYDPNGILDNWEVLRTNDNLQFFNRATQGLYPPGSVFKIVTGTVLLKLDSHLTNLTAAIPKVISADGYRIEDVIDKPFLTFKEAIGYSSNKYFAKHFLEYQWSVIEEEIVSSFKFDMNYSTYGLPIAPANLGTITDKADLAATVIGQGEVLVTPMHMALWAGAVANDGILMKPRVVDKIIDKDNQLVKRTNIETVGTVCSREISQILLSAMEFAVSAGTGKNAQLADVKIGGKTGTAENVHGDSHGWFVGIAPIENPQIVAVAVVENGGSGGETAAPITGLLMQAALEQMRW